MSRGSILKYFLNFFLVSFILVACHSKTEHRLPGYIEGRYTYISANFSGLLNTLYVSKGQRVEKNQPLFLLESHPEIDTFKAIQARLAQGKADLQEAEAEYNLQLLSFDRKQRLFKQNTISKDEYDISLAARDRSIAKKKSAEENLNVLKNDISRALWSLQQKTVNSPIPGLVFDTYYRPGELVSSGNIVLALLDPKEIKIIFYIPEPLLKNLKLNERVNITCDSCKKMLKGKIIFISPEAEYTPPIIYSNEARAKLMYRIEARPILSDVLLELHPGLPVQIELPFSSKT